MLRWFPDRQNFGRVNNHAIIKKRRYADLVIQRNKRCKAALALISKADRSIYRVQYVHSDFLTFLRTIFNSRLRCVCVVCRSARQSKRISSSLC